MRNPRASCWPLCGGCLIVVGLLSGGCALVEVFTLVRTPELTATAKGDGVAVAREDERVAIARKDDR